MLRLMYESHRPPASAGLPGLIAEFSIALAAIGIVDLLWSGWLSPNRRLVDAR